MIDRESNLISDWPAVTLMNIDSARTEICSKLQVGTFPHVILQSRQFDAGERCDELYRAITNSKSKVIVNIDSSARNEYERAFMNLPNNNPNITARFTHEKYSNIPLAGSFVGRNHIRLILLGEVAYLSCLDFAEGCFDRDELFIKISQPELVQMLKMISLWDYTSPKEYWTQSTDRFSLVFDTGKSSKGYLSRYAESQIKPRLKANSTIWIVSSWYPDELEGLINQASAIGCNLNFLINRQYEFESLKKIPFNITKIVSYNHFRNSTSRAFYTKYNPLGKQLHAKFIMMKNGEQCWWLIGTSNHTRFGSNALTSEIGIAGEDKSIGNQLSNYIRGVSKTEA